MRRETMVHIGGEGKGPMNAESSARFKAKTDLRK